ncbi:glycosyltransferase family 2 protein, partial [Phycicoccus flavus]
EQLAALAAQEGIADCEVVVADNGSTDDLRALVEQWTGRLPGLRIVDASRARGVSVARNEGVRAARSDRILICDADDVVGPGWVAALLAALETEAFVGGSFETGTLSGPAAAWTAIPRRSDGLLVSWSGLAYPIGCNTAFRREVFEAAGAYPEDYPPGAEEIDFAWRARQAGYVAAYVPDALVHYRIRADLRRLLRQQFNAGRGHATLHARYRPSDARPRTGRARLRHELVLLSRFPATGGPDARRRWLTQVAFEAGKVRESRRLGVPCP